ncbi:hypothetical protein QF035_000368 [Streptomyces umbrinus]|uniref:SMI1/KNR4 family protein n=1 Tax=Streptomyces umbrinus TaxID=67370 RepID=A0ABU0SGW1_9ACTN|nr:SMI1/KNR4 family protein [Streptomyces umbrinus]MDQ1022786.1 hypothetical protein [Streptomyces umbrinus]
MSERSLSHAWLSSWVGKASDVLNAMTEEFERRHGFPPGTNQVRSANHDDQEAARALVQVDVAAGDLVAFYESVGEVTWEDVGNGYFVDSVSKVLQRLTEYGSVRIGANQEHCGLVVGSNGAGLLYVADQDGAVYRTRTASLDSTEVDRVADGLREFLELLERSLTRFVATGEPGYL